MSGTPLKMAVGEHAREEEHDKTIGKGFCALVAFLACFVVVIFAGAGAVEEIEEALREEELGYRHGGVVRAVFRNEIVEGLVSMRAISTPSGATSS